MSTTDPNTHRAVLPPPALASFRFETICSAAIDDIYTPEALAALEALAGYNRDVKALMAARIERRARRFRDREYISFPRPR